MFVTHQFLCAGRDSFAAIRPKGGLIDTYRSNLKQLRNVRRYRFLSGLSEGSEGTRNPKTLEVRSRRTSAANDQECNKTRPRRSDCRSLRNEHCFRTEIGRYPGTWISATSR